APDVRADEVWIEDVARHERGSDRTAIARMQIREPDGLAHTIQFRRRIKLADGLAFDPVPWGRDEAHFSFSYGAHNYPLELVPEAGIAPASQRLQRCANLPQLLGEIYLGRRWGRKNFATFAG